MDSVHSVEIETDTTEYSAVSGTDRRRIRTVQEKKIKKIKD